MNIAIHVFVRIVLLSLAVTALQTFARGVLISITVTLAIRGAATDAPRPLEPVKSVKKLRVMHLEKARELVQLDFFFVNIAIQSFVRIVLLSTKTVTLAISSLVTDAPTRTS